MRSWPREIKFTAAALGVALGTTLAFLLMPTYSGDGDGGGGGDQTLVDHEGAWVMAVLAVPVALSAAPLLVSARNRRLALLIASGLAVAFVVATGFTVGLFYAPAAILLMLAAARGDLTMK